MNELQTKIVNVVEKAGGSTDWKGLMDGLEYREQQEALRMIRPLQKQGILDRVVSYDPKLGKTTLTISRGKTKIESAK